MPTAFWWGGVPIIVQSKHAKGWKGHLAWRARRRKHVAQRIEKRRRAAVNRVV